MISAKIINLCNKCNRTVETKDIYCKFCGTVVDDNLRKKEEDYVLGWIPKNLYRCKSCGYEYEYKHMEQAKFCPQCGSLTELVKSDLFMGIRREITDYEKQTFTEWMNINSKEDAYDFIKHLINIVGNKKIKVAIERDIPTNDGNERVTNTSMLTCTDSTTPSTSEGYETSTRVVLPQSVDTICGPSSSVGFVQATGKTCGTSTTDGFRQSEGISSCSTRTTE